MLNVKKTINDMNSFKNNLRSLFVRLHLYQLLQSSLPPKLLLFEYIDTTVHFIFGWINVT